MDLSKKAIARGTKEFLFPSLLTHVLLYLWPEGMVPAFCTTCRSYAVRFILLTTFSTLLKANMENVKTDSINESFSFVQALMALLNDCFHVGIIFHIIASNYFEGERTSFFQRSGVDGLPHTI